MYVLVQKVLHIIKEPLTRNRTHQTWRGKQLAMCEEEQPLLDWIKEQPKHLQDKYSVMPNADVVCQCLDREGGAI